MSFAILAPLKVAALENSQHPIDYVEITNGTVMLSFLTNGTVMLPTII
jgi:hypothetical protein